MSHVAGTLTLLRAFGKTRALHWLCINTQALFCQVNMNVSYEVATISRLLKMIGLFCKRALLKRLYSAKETILQKCPIDCILPNRPIILRIWLFCKRDLYFEEPTNCSYPIFIESQCAKTCD